jgi:hypothetical protein
MAPSVLHNWPKLLTWRRRVRVDTRARGLSQNPIVIHNSVTWHRGSRLRFFVGEERNNHWYHKNCISGY